MTRVESTLELDGPLPSGADPADEVDLERFRVLGRLGEGGMGVVLVAEDPDLHRRVAIKVLRGRVWAAGQAELARARLRREAQAMARVAHPNVVAVHEIGGLGTVFVVMELVEGDNAREWARTPRRWREILEVYLQAGEGLAAAHRAELVHRDFKPDNVLVGKDGRVRVADFGIAAALAAARSEPGESHAAGGVTRTASVAGTLGYAPPEQLAGEPIDARADQFAFCVALHEALYGQLPYPGKDFAEVTASFARPPVVPRGRGVPAWLARVLRRGLALRPDDRYPSMTALLAALRETPRRRRRRAAWIMAALVGATVLAVVLTRPAPSPCTPAISPWGPDARARVERAFLASGRRHAAATFARLDEQLSARAARWAGYRCVTAEEAACRAQRRVRFQSLVDLLGVGDPVIVDRALHAVQAHAADGCEPSHGPAVDAVLRELERAALLAAVDRKDEAQRVLDEVAPRASHPVVEADLAAVRGILATHRNDMPAASQAYRACVGAARRVPDAAREVGCAVGLFASLATDEPEAGATDLAQAEALAALVRAGFPAEATLSLRGTNATYLYRRGFVAEAIAVAETLVTDSSITDPWYRVDLLEGYAMLMRGTSPEKLLAAAQAAVVVHEQIFGREHPELAAPLARLAEAERQVGNLDDAERTAQRAIAIAEDSPGENGGELLQPLYQAALVAGERRDLPRVRLYATRAIAVADAIGHTHGLSAVLTECALAYIRAGSPADAGPLIDRSLTLSDDPQLLAFAYLLRGWAARDLGQHEAALAACESALTSSLRAYGEISSMVANALLCQGQAFLVLGRSAVAVVERALVIFAAMRWTGTRLAAAQLLLARALVADGRERARARLLADQARAAYLVAGPGSSKSLAEVEAFLAGLARR